MIVKKAMGRATVSVVTPLTIDQLGRQIDREAMSVADVARDSVTCDCAPHLLAPHLALDTNRRP